MLTIVRRGYSFLVAKPIIRILLQTFVSLVLIGLLLNAVQTRNVAASLQSLQPMAVAAAAVLLVAGYTLNSRRWQLLLRNVGIHERLGALTSLYFIGQFFSLFLPTSAGGDAVRVYDVARRSHRTTQAIVATLQERLFGLAASLLVGLIATFYYLPLVPLQLRLWIFIIQVGGACGIVLLLYPRLIIAVANRIWRNQGDHPFLPRVANHPWAARLSNGLRSVSNLPLLTPLQCVALLILAITSTLLGTGMFYVLGVSLGIRASFIAFCLVVPLVWIVRMIPVSLNGVGVGEGAFVFLMGLFAVPSEHALALAVAVLALQTGFALIGGLLLALRMARGSWAGARAREAKEL